ncbi:hypothetical protein Vadar_013664 [Vaccinium darrowii]|uniref:Uncharacterized protein n=1 Tax=Vaccinium darrowii TaxID=229202 RepID=A0ACB7Z647_9ERIC|nr:hypothetical protein Vadar_013664 [Vaccinium darrowii]
MQREKRGRDDSLWKRRPKDLPGKKLSPMKLVRLMVVGPDEIATDAAVGSGVPDQTLTANERMLLVGLNELLKKRCVGQDEAVSAIC